ncbi:MAG: hypothetical protein O7D94_08735 [Planctomycetota bacterium]|nr:hypothetical protein [Planctomycetota bacterium]
MNAIQDFITRLSVWLGDLAFTLLGFLSPVVILWFLSAVFGVLMLLVWRYTSNQDAIADVRRKIAAHLLATRLFKDNLSVTFRAQRLIVFHALRLLVYSVRPVLIMTGPFLLIMVQIGLRYEFRPIPVGKVANISVTLKPGSDMNGPGCKLRLPPALRHDPIDPMRAEYPRTVDWRITASKAGNHTLVFGDGEDRVVMPLTVGDGFERISSIRGGGFWDRLLYSAEPSIPESSIFESIRIINYDARSTPLFGYDVHWLVTFLILSLVFALLFKPILKVHI